MEPRLTLLGAHLPAVALETLLQADGIPAPQIPIDLDARAAQWHDCVAGRRLLLVLDGAAGTSQLTPPLPAPPGCLVLITSRRKLTTMPGAVFMSLDVLPSREAVDLFAQRAGRDCGNRPRSSGSSNNAATCRWRPP